MRGAGLEVLVADPGGDLEHGALDPLGVVGLGAQRDALVGEHVPVAAALGLDLPRLAGAEPVERELDVAAQLRARARVAGLVVDQLVAALGRRSTRSTRPRSWCGPIAKEKLRSSQTGCDSERWCRSW